MVPRPSRFTLFPYTTLFRSIYRYDFVSRKFVSALFSTAAAAVFVEFTENAAHIASNERTRSEEHTSELQSHVNLVCRLLLEKKKAQTHHSYAVVAEHRAVPQ